jgi:hypothetical protein
MRTLFLGICIAIASTLQAQRQCVFTEYAEQQLKADPQLASRNSFIEQFIQSQPLHKTEGENISVIRIPVVVHVVYNTSSQNVSDEQVKSQIDALNRDFRRQNADSVNTPARFKSLAADVPVEFVLATADPEGRPTNGIVRRQTNVTYWNSDDKIKSTAQGGDDAWDSHSYLNLWVGNLRSLLGYSSVLGCDPAKDGIVINITAFGTINAGGAYNMGRTVVHEVGHWLGLRHIWGDTYCGDDLVDDTPKQGNFTAGCPNTFRSSCSNGTLGDMYMNYMDYTNDACMNLFTQGQKQRMMSMFAPGGPRQNLLQSKGLFAPWTEPLPFVEPVRTKFVLYPNPAFGEVVLNFEYDESWVGKKVTVVNSNGVVVATVQVNSRMTKFSTTRLSPGVYFIQANDGGRKIAEKFIKL